MRIAVGSVTYPLANGVTVSINTSVDGFLARNHQMAIIAPHYEELGKIRPEHHPVSSSEIGRWFMSALHKKERLFSATTSHKEITEIVKKFRPEAFWLHTLTWAPNAFEKIMLDSKTPKVLTYHTLVEDYGRAYAGEVGAWRMRVRSKEVCNEVDSIIVPSSVIAKRLVNYGVTKPMHVIPTGISLPDEAYSKAELAERFKFHKDSNLLLYVGRVSKEKNIELLLKMVKPVLQKTNSILLLVGPGDILDTEEFAEKIGIRDKIFCTSALPKEDTQKIYAAADVFVFASQTETQGLVIGEAMLAGTPVVALISSIQPEIYPEHTALVAKTEAEFPKQLELMLSNDALRKQLTEEGKKFVQKNFSIDGMIDKQEKLFEDLIG